MNRILVIDDDTELCELLTDYLRAEGFTVSAAHEAEDGLAAALSGNHELVVLDVMLPGMNGFDVLRHIRACSTLPVLMLTARGEEIDRIIGLEIGADDYLPKPFGPRELLARLHALLRRGQGPAAGAQRFGPFVLDAAGRRLLRDGVEVPLANAEYELLAALIARPNRILSRDTLVDLLRGYDRSPFDRSVDVRVARLRRHIEADPAAPLYIRTVRGEGYLFNPHGGDR